MPLLTSVSGTVFLKLCLAKKYCREGLALVIDQVILSNRFFYFMQLTSLNNCEQFILIEIGY